MRCNKCGNELDVDTRVVLTSYPPQYNAYCPTCGERTYIFCSEYFGQHNSGIETRELGKWTRDELIDLINDVIDERLKRESVKPKPATLIIRDGDKEEIIDA